MKTIIKSLILVTGLAIAAPLANAQVSVGIGISARIAPPAIPVYVQPDCPVDGYLWTPGYWAWDNDDNDYYWVPGAWVAPPDPGYLWTPPYWAFADGYYGFHAGYWGLHVGFYGGINYGFGYGGSGYYGGRWDGGHFRYNTAVTRVNTRIVHNTYVNNSFSRNNSRSSFNGPGGSNARPTSQEAAAARDHHVAATRSQTANQTSARGNRAQRAGVNHGSPSVASRANGRSFSSQGHTSTVTHSTTRTTQRTNSVQHSTNAARQQGQQQRMQSRAQSQQHNAPRQQHSAPMQQHTQSAPRQMGGGGGRPMGGGGGHMGGGGGDHRR